MIFTKIFPSFEISETLSFLLVSLIIYISQFYYRYFTRPNPLPGPFPLPFFGNALQSIGWGFNDWLLSMHKKYGDIYEMDLAGQRVIVLCRADLIENMSMSSTKTKYPFRVKVTEGFAEYGLDGVGIFFNNERKSWKYNRQFFSQAMMTPSFNHQAVEWTSELWEEMESCWNKIGENQELDLTKWMRRFTNDIIFRIATGVKNETVTSYYNTFILENNDSLSEKEKRKIKDSEDFTQSIETFMNGVIYFYTFNKFTRHYVPFIRGKVKSLLKNRDYLFDRMYKIIRERRIEIENTSSDKPLRQDMLTSYITANTSRDINPVKHADDPDLLRPMSDKEIFGNILDAMLGGTDTTATLFCFIVYYLGHYPEVRKRFLQELDQVLGKDVTKPITYKEVEELQYCDAIIKEVNRHCPVIFVNGRVSVEDDYVGGYNWSKGTLFQMLHSAIMKRKDYWTDPEKFDPNRFYKVDESDKYLLEKKKIKNTFTIFGEGIRMCPGRKLAMIELKCLLALVYRKYDVELADMNAPLKYSSEFITFSDELIIKVKSRKTGINIIL